MKSKMLKVLVVSTLVACGNQIYSQNESKIIPSKKNSIGIGYNWHSNNELAYSLNYRRFYSRFNLKGMLIYSKGDNSGGWGSMKAMLTIPDSDSKFIGVGYGYYSKIASLKVKLGIEHTVDLGKVGFIQGFDLFIGDEKTAFGKEVNKFELTIQEESQTYYPVLDSGINHRTSHQSNLLLGAAITLGLKVKVYKNWNLTYYSSLFLINKNPYKTQDLYRNENYKEVLGKSSESSYWSLRSDHTLELNFMF